MEIIHVAALVGAGGCVLSQSSLTWIHIYTLFYLELKPLKNYCHAIDCLESELTWIDICTSFYLELKPLKNYCHAIDEQSELMWIDIYALHST